MLLQMTIAPHLAPVLAAACELEYQVLLTIDAHPTARPLADKHRRQMEAKGSFAKLGKLLSILLSCSGVSDPKEKDYLVTCVKLRNQLLHGSYREAVKTLFEMPQLSIVENVVSFGAPLGFDVPSFETRLEEILMFLNEPRLGPTIVQALEGGHLLLAIRVNRYYEKLHNIDTPMMVVHDFPGKPKADEK